VRRSPSYLAPGGNIPERPVERPVDRRTRGGSTDAVDQLVELAGERGDVGELRRLAAGGSRDAADVLTERAEDQDDDSE
jgi:hypothetical protein